MGTDRRVIISADDFGLSVAVNEAVELAYTRGILSTASLMVAGPAAADAVDRAKRLPGLRVGLHLVVVEGHATRPDAALTDAAGLFPSGQAGLGVRYFFNPRVRRRLRAEIRAQYAAFAATGLVLDHANAHKHMHLHPTVGQMLIGEGRAFGLRAIRVPAEPPAIIAACSGTVRASDRLLYRWTGLLRHQARRAGLRTNDHVFGLAWSGRMTAGRLHRLAGLLPPGLSEIYFHPASRSDPALDALMPGYEHQAELQALTDPRSAALLGPFLTRWS